MLMFVKMIKFLLRYLNTPHLYSACDAMGLYMIDYVVVYVMMFA